MLILMPSIWRNYISQCLTPRKWKKTNVKPPSLPTVLLYRLALIDRLFFSHNHKFCYNYKIFSHHEISSHNYKIRWLMFFLHECNALLYILKVNQYFSDWIKENFDMHSNNEKSARVSDVWSLDRHTWGTCLYQSNKVMKLSQLNA